MAAEADGDLREHVLRTLQEVWNNRNWDYATNSYADDIVIHTPDSPEPVRGRAGFRQFFDTLIERFPDFRFDVDCVLVEGNMAAVRITSTGTSEGPILGLPPTGKSYRVSDAFFLEFGPDRRVREMWAFTDRLAVMEQIGLMPSGPPPRALVALLRLAQKLRRA